VGAVIALLEIVPTPSIDGLDKVYHQLKEILGITTVHQEESSLQCQVEISISSLGHSKGV
jgi:Asp-tRNA(Asn)/Glu-tRNA(Gln) amidotransferase B subunit